MDEKLIELARMCEELYGMSNKKYSDGVWEEKLWGQTGEERKKIPHVPMFFVAHFEATIILLITEVQIINSTKCIPW